MKASRRQTTLGMQLQTRILTPTPSSSSIQRVLWDVATVVEEAKDVGEVEDGHLPGHSIVQMGT